jgi:signal transduction histidine kinase/DNA-binding NarL/FixJ family response regulator
MELWIVNNTLKITMAFTFALALARKFNREYADLVALKENLEQKVSEKTHELLQAKVKIENESRLRTEYFIQVAHETKTPLTLIGNYLHRLRKVNGMSHELQVVQDNFQLLLDTMILFLDSEKLEKGQLLYSHEHALDLTGFIKRKIPLYTECAAQHNLVFRTDVSENLVVQCDILAMERILNNLVDNAIKYTSEGEIHLTLKAEGNTAVLKVQDSGAGLSKEQLPYVFDRFFQGTSPENTNGGLGMGLFIVRETVKSLQGTIDVHSQPGKGTIFTVGIPLTTAKACSQIYEAETPNGREIPKTIFEVTRKNILLVEDHHDLSAYLVSELNENYNVFHAGNGCEALELLKTTPVIDLIISDVMMHRMSGYTFFESLLQHPVYNHTPFIFITARSNHDEKIGYLNKGAVDYIYKPFSIEELQAKIHAILTHTEHQRKAGLAQAIQAISNSMQLPAAVSHDKWTIFETRKRHYGLTDRQTEVIREVEKGSDYRQIAETLHISQKTIHRHIQILFEKFGVHNKIDLLRKLFEN